MKRLKLLFTLALPVLLLQNTQAQTGSRLIAQAHWSNTGAMFVPVDTTNYTYTSNAYGGDLNHTLMFGESVTMVANDTSYILSKKTLQDIPSSTIKTKTNLTYNAFTNTWTIVDRFNYWYNASGKVSKMIYQTYSGSWVNVSSNDYTYDAAGNLQLDKYSVFSFPGFNPVSQKTYYYAGAQLTDEIDANIASGITYTQSYHYDYDTANRLSTVTYATWNGTGFVNNNQHSYNYDASGNRLTDLYTLYNTGTGAWDNTLLKNYSSFTGGHNPMMEIDQLWDTTGGGYWYNHKHYSYSYNGVEQMTNMTGTSWNIAGFWENENGDPMANYYYAPYSPTAVNNVAATSDVSIFPIPAQNILNINLNWNEAQAFTINIFDMSGRAIKSINVAETKKYSTTIATDNMPAGNYVVNINGTNGQVSRQFVVVH
jgi:hypothetical protein